MPARDHPRSELATALSLAGSVGALTWFGLAADGRVLDPLVLVLAGSTLVANLLSVRYERLVLVSASFSCAMLAIALLGPAAAFAVVALAEPPTWLAKRFRLRAVAINIAGTGLPVLVAGTLFETLSPAAGRGGGHLAFPAALAVAAVVALVLNFATVSVLTGLEAGEPVAQRLRPPRALVPALTWTLVLTVTLALAYRRVGPVAGAIVILAVLGFTYMLQLVVAGREKSRQYASLSWSVVNGLLRTIERRDPRAARHAAAVAGFARDVAQASGLPPADCELAHTAGLLHDVGKVALPDRAMDHDAALGREDWESVRRHPELGAEMLRDLGSYGPVAEAVRSHHERPDGRGYPDGLPAEAIPEIAKIVAVAEVYDTLTADDGYRPRLSSFEALTELRRVAGSQLEARYVEALALLLAGRSTDYRHATAADFDQELALERRIAEAALR